MPFTYLEAIKQLFEPEAKEMLSKVVENSDEEIKKPNSRARKLLDSFIAMLLNISIVEKVMGETQALIADAERLISGKEHRPRPEPSAHFGTREEEALEEKNERARIKSLQTLLTRLYDDMKELRMHRGKVVQQLNAQLDELDEQKVYEIQQLVSNKFGLVLTNNQVVQAVNLYINLHPKRATEQTEQLQILTDKAMKPSLEPVPVAKGTQELAEERAYHAGRFNLQAFARLGQTYGAGSQIQLIGLLKEEFGSNVRMEIILILANRLGGTEEKYQKLRMDVQQRHQKTIEEIDNLTQKLGGIISHLESGLGRKATVHEICGPVVQAEAELDAIRATTLSKTPTLKVGA